MSPSVGRNTPCPCGSGKKYKKCCGRASHKLDDSLKTAHTIRRVAPVAHVRARETPRHEVPPHVLRHLEEKVQKRKEYRRVYGDGNPPVTVGRGDERVVIVGSKIFKSSEWKSFHEFLVYYGFHVFGQDWMNQEFAKSMADRHPMAQWLLEVQAFQARKFRPDATRQLALMTGSVRAYMRTAYDLYVLDHNKLLQQLLLKRLSNPVGFQAARYEAYVAAAVVKAGFKIALEDETDASTSHCEFTATHTAIGAHFSIEAKSRHRKGYLGQPGERPEPEAIKAQIQELLQKALRKRAEHQRIVFIDVNVPPEKNPIFQTQWVNKLADDLDEFERNQQRENEYPSAFLFFSNHVEHYIQNDEPAPGVAVLCSAINISDFRKNDASVLKRYPAISALFESLSKHTKIPMDFLDKWRLPVATPS